MAILVASVREVEARETKASESPTIAFARTRSRFGSLWPPALVAIGLGLSVAWTASLLWLFYAAI
jgi:hypothetical protein